VIPCIADDRRVCCWSNMLLLCAGELVQVLACVLDYEEDEEGHLTCLHIIHDLMLKSHQVFALLQLNHPGWVKNQDSDPR
jgi:hypothetical protein